MGAPQGRRGKEDEQRRRVAIVDTGDSRRPLDSHEPLVCGRGQSPLKSLAALIAEMMFAILTGLRRALGSWDWGHMGRGGGWLWRQRW